MSNNIQSYRKNSGRFVKEDGSDTNLADKVDELHDAIINTGEAKFQQSGSILALDENGDPVEITAVKDDNDDYVLRIVNAAPHGYEEEENVIRVKREGDFVKQYDITDEVGEIEPGENKIVDFFPEYDHGKFKAISVWVRRDPDYETLEKIEVGHNASLGDTTTSGLLETKEEMEPITGEFGAITTTKKIDLKGDYPILNFFAKDDVDDNFKPVDKGIIVMLWRY